MAEAKKETIKVFRVVSLGEELPSADISDLLTKGITLNSQKPDTFFTVTECALENDDYTPS